MAENAQFNRPLGCIFCGSLSLSKEHYLPKWLMKYVSTEGRVAIHRTDTSSYIDGEYRHESPQPGRLQRAKGQVQRTLRIVCRNCNNTWMSNLHTECLPSMVNYVTGGWTALGTDQSERFAAWTTMHIMVREFASDKRAIRESERRDFYFNRTAPENWYIWIGLYAAQDPGAFSAFAAVRPLPISDRNAPFVGHSHVSTIILGRLIIHCVGTQKTEILPFLTGEYSERLGLSPIWFGAPFPISVAPHALTHEQFGVLVLHARNALLEKFTRLGVR